MEKGQNLQLNSYKKNGLKKPKTLSFFVLDDNESSNFISKLILEESVHTHKVVTFNSVFDAKKFLSEQTPQTMPDVFLVDLNLPTQKGFDFIATDILPIRKKSTQKNLIYILTTSTFKYDIILADENPNIEKLINKPLSLEKVSEIYSAYCRK